MNFKLDKYIEYMLLFFDINSYTKAFAQVSFRMNYVFFLLLNVASILLSSTPLVESPEKSGILACFAFGFYGFSLVYLLISGTILFTKYIHDLERVLNSSEDPGRKVMVCIRNRLFILRFGCLNRGVILLLKNVKSSYLKSEQ